jgi:hypothetical protein
VGLAPPTQAGPLGKPTQLNGLLASLMGRRPPKHFIGPLYLTGRPEWAPHWEDRDRRRTPRAVSDAHSSPLHDPSLLLALTTDLAYKPLIKPAVVELRYRRVGRVIRKTDTFKVIASVYIG